MPENTPEQPIVMFAAEALALCRLGTRLAPLADLSPPALQAQLLELLAEPQTGADLLTLLRVCFGQRVDLMPLHELLALMLSEGPAKVEAMLTYVKRNITPALAGLSTAFGAAR